MSSLQQKMISFEKQYNCNNYAPLPVVIARGKGPWAWDVDGRKYLDCLSAYSALNHGHLHPRIVKAMRDQLNKIAITGRATFNSEEGEALKELCETTGYERAIMMNSGVESGETAIKFARKWAYQVKGVAPNKASVIFAKDNFWGRTLAACGSSDDPDRYHHFGPFGYNFKLVDYNSVEALEAALKEDPNVAAFMVEPIQGEAGVVMPAPEYLKKVRELCDKHKVLLIVDEVQTGLGRTGRILCQEHSGVRADMVCLGKSLSGGLFPISAVCGTAEVFDVISPGEHGSTFGGNPLAAKVCAESLRVLRQEGFAENSRIMGEYLQKGLRSILKENKIVKEVRGKGLFTAIEVVKGQDAAYYAKSFLKQGIITKQTHDVVLRFAPPLMIGQEECDYIIEKADHVFNHH